MKHLIDLFFKPLNCYLLNQTVTSTIDEPLWLYRLQELEKNEVFLKFSKDKQLLLLKDNHSELELLILYILFIVHREYVFDNLSEYFKSKLVTMATNSQYKHYATSLLITFLLRSSNHTYLNFGINLLQGNKIDFSYDENLQHFHIGDVEYRNPLGRTFIDLSYTDFSNETEEVLNNIPFEGQYLKGCNFTGRKFNRKKLYFTCFEEANLERTCFKSCFCTGASFNGAQIQFSEFSKNEFSYSSFIRARLQDVEAQHNTFNYVNFYSANLTKAIFSRSTMVGCYWEQAIIRGIDLKSVDLRRSKMLTFAQLSDVEYLDKAKLSPDLLTPDQFQLLQKNKIKNNDKSKSFLILGDEEPTDLEVVQGYVYEMLEKEYIDNKDKEERNLDKSSSNWPSDKSSWIHIDEWNGSDKRNQTCVLGKNEFLYKIVEYYVRSTSDYCTYYAKRFAFTGLKKAFSDRKAVEDFLKNQLLKPPHHIGQALSIDINKIHIQKNVAIWQKYNKVKVELKKKLGDKSKPLQVAEVKWHASSILPNGLPVLDESVGECWLFHGTSIEVSQKICQGGFTSRFATKSLLGGFGTLGKGIYLTDNFAKAATYVKCKHSHFNCAQCKQSEKVIFVVRALLGNIYIDKTKSRRGEKGPPKGYDSCWGPDNIFDPSSAFNCNEFMVDEDHVYPEFCIFYTDNPKNIIYKDISHKSLLPYPDANDWISNDEKLSPLVFVLKNYFRLIAYGTFEQQYNHLYDIENYVKAMIKENDHKELPKLIKTINDERKKLQSLLDDTPTPNLPYPYDCWVDYLYRHDNFIYIIKLIEEFFKNYSFNNKYREAWYYKLIALCYNKMTNQKEEEMIINFNKAWCIIGDNEVDNILFNTGSITKEEYFKKSLSVLKTSNTILFNDKFWLQRLCYYNCDLLLSNKLTIELWLGIFDNIHQNYKKEFEMITLTYLEGKKGPINIPNISLSEKLKMLVNRNIVPKLENSSQNNKHQYDASIAKGISFFSAKSLPITTVDQVMVDKITSLNDKIIETNDNSLNEIQNSIESDNIDINCKGNNGWTLLYTAVVYNAMKIAILLVSKDADPDIDISGDTARKNAMEQEEPIKNIFIDYKPKVQTNKFN